MVDVRKRWVGELVLRIGGAGLLALCWLLLARLFHAPDLRQLADPAIGELAAAAAALPCFSAGAMLVCLGARIFDPVAVSERWASCADGEA